MEQCGAMWSSVEQSGGWRLRVEVVLLEEAPGSERANNNDLCQSWP